MCIRDSTKAQGGGMVLDWGVHLLDQMNMMMGKMPVSVYATLSNVTNEEVDDGFTATFKFDNDLVFTVEVGTSNFINLPRWYVEGLNGTAVIDDFQVNGKIVIAYMDKEAMDLDGENSDYYATIPRCIKGCEIAALFKYRGEKETRISLRAKEYANVGKLAEEFGGGGHWKASGCTIHETFADAEPVFVKAAEKYL